MSKEEYDKTNDEQVKEITFLRYLVFILGIALLIIGIGAYKGAIRKDVVILPSNIGNKPLSYTNETMSDSALDINAEYVASHFLNLTPENAIKQMEAILFMVEPDYYGTYKAAIESQANYIQKTGISQVFRPQHKTYGDGKVAIYGILEQSIGKTLVANDMKVLEIKYLIIDGNFRLFEVQLFTKKDYEEKQANEQYTKTSN